MYPYSASTTSYKVAAFLAKEGWHYLYIFIRRIVSLSLLILCCSYGVYLVYVLITFLDSVIITGIVRAIEGWNPQQGAQNPRWVKTEIWSSVHGKYTFEIPIAVPSHGRSKWKKGGRRAEIIT